jgi:hypothetical protein
MSAALPRWLLAIAAALLLLSVIMHTSAFPQTRAAVGASNLTAFFRQALPALWLIESMTLLMLAVVFGLVAARPAMASGAVVALLAFIPAGTAGMLYRFVGGRFVPAHVLLLAAALAFVAGLLRAVG